MEITKKQRKYILNNSFLIINIRKRKQNTKKNFKNYLKEGFLYLGIANFCDKNSPFLVGI